MGVFSEKGDCDMMGKSKGSVKGVLTCYLIKSRLPPAAPENLRILFSP